MPKITLGDSHIARRRRAIGMDQSTFATLVRLTPDTFARIERQERKSSPNEAARIELVLASYERTHAEIFPRIHLLVTAGGSAAA